MIAVVLLACAVAVAAPSPVYRVVERTLRPAPRLIPATVVLASAFAVVFGRVSLVVAAAMAGATLVHVLRARRDDSTARRRSEAAATYLGAVSTNLQAGAAMPDALARAAEQVPSPLQQEAARLTQLARSGATLETHVPELERLGTLWALSVARGVPLAKLVAALRDDIDHANRHRDATRAALAGPQTTAVVLALLPIAGVLMGTAMGAKPLAFLTGGGLGGVLLVVGTALVCAGVAASRRIIEGAST